MLGSVHTSKKLNLSIGCFNCSQLVNLSALSFGIEAENSCEMMEAELHA